jgi:hypothetical protein
LAIKIPIEIEMRGKCYCISPYGFQVPEMIPEPNAADGSVSEKSVDMKHLK